MLGLVLWFNPKSGAGVIWSEDQGALVFLDRKARLPAVAKGLVPGDGVRFGEVECNGVRRVTEITRVFPGLASTDPRDLIAEAAAACDRPLGRRVVA